ncbi:MAG: hypothetical protein HOC71_05655 [Candidatus Latescibacteria bacterium]|nr:hypothetical protein [Candidatus Latescibacterota bacterium]
MAVQNVNNVPGAGGDVGRERAERTTKTERTPQTPPETREIEQAAVRPLQDEVRISRDRELVGELVDEAANTDVPPRQEVVDRASRRVQENYYNSREFIGNLASRLINTDSV